MAPFSGWDILGSNWTFSPQSRWVRSRKNGQAEGFEWVWQRPSVMAQQLGQSISKTQVVHGKNSGEPVTGSWTAKADWRTFGLIQQATKLMLVLIESCQNTAHCSLLHIELHGHRLVRVSMLTPVHRRQRQQRAGEHQNWNMKQWKKVAWSDESRFSYTPHRLHHFPGEHAAPGCNMGRRQAGGGTPIQVDVTLSKKPAT